MGWLTETVSVLGKTRHLSADAARRQRAWSTGARRRLALMFTDIVESTSLVVALGDVRWARLLREHDGLVRARLERFGGTEAKQVGDGFFAVFECVDAALGCGIAIQRSLADRQSRDGWPLDVRIGIHLADVVCTGDDYVGRGVHETARIAKFASGAEVLASAFAVAQARRHIGSEPRFVVLRGLPEPMEVLTVQSRVTRPNLAPTGHGRRMEPDLEPDFSRP